MTELTITKERVLEAAQKCSQAKETLKTLFPEVFKEERKYPYFGKWRRTSLVVLFTRPKTGIVVVPDAYNSLGYLVEDDWDETGFTILTEPFTVNP